MQVQPERDNVIVPGERPGSASHPLATLVGPAMALRESLEGLQAPLNRALDLATLAPLLREAQSLIRRHADMVGVITT
jgi:hypothetical protein